MIIILLALVKLLWAILWSMLVICGPALICLFLVSLTIKEKEEKK